MRQTELFTKTSKDSPKDEQSINSILLLRAGFIDREIAGVYSFLPLGNRVLQKIIDVIRDEMNKIGGQELLLTALQSPGTWESTNRWDDSSMDIWFKTKLKNKKDLGLAPTHEEPITNLMKKFITSYKDLPIYAYQFQTKFRNETRAKSGILRTREFIMKDLYSFCSDEQSLDEFYERAKEAYIRIFDRLGIGSKTYVTFASGSTFSKYSHEFQTVCDYGEDTIYIHEQTRIAVNSEIYNDEVLTELGLLGEKFTEAKSIEVGNIFKLGTKFSSALGLTYNDANGQQSPVVMGSYGIGPARVMGTIVESNYDDNGIIWPKEIAPFHIHLIHIGKDDESFTKAEQIYSEILNLGYEVLYDDRSTVSPGAKFKDSDLIGCPLQVIISQKNLKENVAELKTRSTGKKEFIQMDQLTEHIEKFMKNET
jgi:prolyl-tRNA synthetase